MGASARVSGDKFRARAHVSLVLVKTRTLGFHDLVARVTGCIKILKNVSLHKALFLTKI